MSIDSLAIHTITLQNTTTAVDAVGGMSRTWLNATTRRARVQPLNGTETVRYGRDIETRMIRIYIPSAPLIDHTWRIKFKGEIYKILSVHNVDHLNHHTRVIAELQT